MMSESDTLHINCWFPCEDISHVFSVTIPRTDNVSHLRDAIKKEKISMYDFLPAHLLELWKVDITPKNLTKKPDLEPSLMLWPFTPLYELFGVAPDDINIHILVRCPPETRLLRLPIKINWSIFGDPYHYIFSVTIESTESVGTLRNIIQNALGDIVSEAEACQSHLWKTSMPLDDRLKDDLDTFDRNWELLMPTLLLSDVFDVRRDKCLHVIIQLPTQCLFKLTETEDEESLNELRAKLKTYRLRANY
ncbi:hypothetical protein BDR07DRAFT_1608996 [Suillus spraguei]|nr:hypothetical protein BDR07DRAFT_1608996 [Suillus spraguei]